MTEQSTNGPVGRGRVRSRGLERGAELSAQMVRPQPAAEVTPERTAAELRARLELIREVKRTAMTQGRRLRGGARNRQGDPVQTRRGEAGDRVQARRAAAQRADLGPRRAPHRDLPGDRVPRADRRPAGLRGGDLLKPRAQVAPTASRSAPARTAARPRSSRARQEIPAAGWSAGKKRDGCGAKFPDGDDPRIEGQEVGRDREPRPARHVERRRQDVEKARVRRRGAVGHRRLGDLHPGHRRRPHRGRGERARTRAGRVRRTQAGRQAGRDQAVRRRPRPGQERCGKSSKASSTATCPRRPRKRCCSPPRRRPAAAEPRAQPHGERSQRQRVITRAADAGQGGDGATQSVGRRSAGQPGGRADESTRQPPGARGRGARAQPARRRGCGRSRPTRGVGDAELANLIRNAVAQGPIPAERARTALPTMLARISEEISERTVELVDMFYPPAGPSPERAGPARPRASTSGRSNRRRRHERRAAAAAGDGRRRRRVPGHAAGRDRAGDAPRIHGRPAARRATAGSRWRTPSSCWPKRG